MRLVGEAVEAYRAAADGKTVTTAEEPKDVRIDLPVDAHLPPDYIASDRLRLEGYRRLAAAGDDAAIAAVVEELTDRYGPLPEPAQRLVAVARLRLLCRAAGITEVVGAVGGDGAAVAGDAAGFRAGAAEADVSGSAATAPPRPTVQVPIPRAGGVGAPRIRDVELVQMVADLVTALQGKPQQEIGITNREPMMAHGDRRVRSDKRDDRRLVSTPAARRWCRSKPSNSSAARCSTPRRCPSRCPGRCPRRARCTPETTRRCCCRRTPNHPAVTARLAAGARLISAPEHRAGERLVDAVAMMDKLRTAGPWESEQTHDSLRRYLLEETYELLDAVRSGNADQLREELGDVLLQVLFHARIAEDAPQLPFTIDDVADTLMRKLGNRVPGVLAGEIDFARGPVGSVGRAQGGREAAATR